MCVTSKYALLLFILFLLICIMCVLWNYAVPFFLWFCNFRSFVFHLLMPFLFSREFPNFQFVPLNYAVIFAWVFKTRLFVYHWIMPFPFRVNFQIFSLFHWIMPLYSPELLKLDYVFSIELFPSVFRLIFKNLYNVFSIQLCSSLFRIIL